MKSSPTLRPESTSRSTYVARAGYKATWPPETFIVPLLGRRIETLLHEWALPNCTGARALDIGCGRQPFRSQLESMGYIYRSLDAVQNPEGTVDFLATIDGILPPQLYAEPSFDFLVCTEVLEHVADWSTAFRNLSSLLKPGGFALITCPYFYPLHEAPYDFWRPTPYAIRHHAEANGLSVELLEQAGDNWDVLGTFLSEAWAYPRTYRMSHRTIAWIVRKLLRMGFRLLVHGRLQKCVELRGPFYLSNLAVLKRTDELVKI